jgi:hypothetical protein
MQAQNTVRINLLNVGYLAIFLRLIGLMLFISARKITPQIIKKKY